MPAANVRSRTRVAILGAAGRDFHNFNVVYRDDPASEVVAFTAAQIPGIDHPVVLYPIAILSVLGVLALLIAVYSVLWMLIMRQENVFDSLNQMWMPFLAGTTLTFLMIAAIDLHRFQLTGTWGAFPLG